MGNLSETFESAKDNITFLIAVLVIIAVIFLLSRAAECAIAKKNKTVREKLNAKRMAAIGMFSAVAVILMMFEFSLPFLAPPFYQLDFSEIPVLVCSFAFGPVAGVLVELVKVLLHIVLKGTTTAFVGDFANFAIGCSFIIPASVIYQCHKSKKMALIGCLTGTLAITIFGTAFNAVYLLPRFAELFGMPLDSIIAMGSQINGSITNIQTFVAICVAPINFLKGLSVSIVVLFIYKPISRILHNAM